MIGGERFEPLKGVYFCKECGEKNISTLKTANLKTVTALTDKSFFQRYSPLILHFFFTKPRPG